MHKPLLAQLLQTVVVCGITGLPLISIADNWLSSRTEFGLSGYASLERGFLAEDFADEQAVTGRVDDSTLSHNAHKELIAIDQNVAVQNGFSPYIKLSTDPEARTDQPSLWGLKWQHTVDSDNSFALSASRGEGSFADSELSLTTNSMAFSWTNRNLGKSKSSLSGSIYVADEALSEAAYQDTGRLYYGFAVGGQYALSKSHAPYVAFHLQKSDLNSEMPFYSESYSDDYYSRLSAGWDWKIMQNWKMRAEANYTLNGSELDWRHFDANRVFLGTQYEFDK